MKEFWQGLTGQILAALVPLVVVGVVGLLIWRKLFGDKTATNVINETMDAAATIPKGIASVLGSAVRGESSSTYITDAQQRQLAAEALARKRAAKGL